MLKAILVLAFVVAANGQGGLGGEQPLTARSLARDIYHDCLKDLHTDCVETKVMDWLRRSLRQNEVILSDNLSIVRTGKQKPLSKKSPLKGLNEQEQIIENVEQFLETHSLRIRAPEYFQTAEARSLMPSFILNNPLTRGALVPLTDSDSHQSMLLVFTISLLLTSFTSRPGLCS